MLLVQCFGLYNARIEKEACVCMGIYVINNDILGREIGGISRIFFWAFTMHGFLQDQTECTRTCFFDLKNKDKPIFIKELKKVWEGTDVGLLRLPTQFSSSNTLLIDNEPYKALLNPVRFQLNYP